MIVYVFAGLAVFSFVLALVFGVNAALSKGNARYNRFMGMGIASYISGISWIFAGLISYWLMFL